MSKDKSLWIYLLLWMLYLLQGAIWGDGTVYSQVIVIVIVLWSGYIFCKRIKRWPSLPISLRVLTILLLSYCLYGGYAMIMGEKLYVKITMLEVYPFSYMKQAMVSILPLYVFYDYGIRGLIKIRFLKLMSIVFFGVIIVVTVTNEARLLQKAIEMGSNATEFTNNSSYSFIYLIAYLYLFKNKKISIPFMIGISIALLAGMKRGAIFIGAIGIIIYLHDTISSASFRQKAIWMLFIFVMIITLGFFISDLYDTSPFFRNRVDQTLSGYVSRRDVIIDSLMKFYTDHASILQQLFGDGANATLRHAENFAHNDWIEMLIDQGIVGVMLLFSFYLTLWMDVRRLKRYSHTDYNIARNIYIVTFLKTLFSMSICSMMPYMTLLLGYILPRLYIHKHNNAHERLSPNFSYSTSL